MDIRYLKPLLFTSFALKTGFGSASVQVNVNEDYEQA